MNTTNPLALRALAIATILTATAASAWANGNWVSSVSDFTYDLTVGSNNTTQTFTGVSWTPPFFRDGLSFGDEENGWAGGAIAQDLSDQFSLNNTFASLTRPTLSIDPQAANATSKVDTFVRHTFVLDKTYRLYGLYDFGVSAIHGNQNAVVTFSHSARLIRASDMAVLVSGDSASQGKGVWFFDIHSTPAGIYYLDLMANGSLSGQAGLGLTHVQIETRGDVLLLDPIPEPGTLLVLGSAIGGFVVRRRRIARGNPTD